MATDGVKIIDGDTAYDTYNGIMDLYDTGETAEGIREQKPFPPKEYADDFDYEVMVTAYAQAFWEIGFMSEDIIAEVKRVIEAGTCVKSWTEEGGAKAGKARQKELDKLWEKINSPNPKIRKRKKYKKVTEFLFEVNDVLTFCSSEGNHFVLILLDIYCNRNMCDYRFAITDYRDNQPPAVEQIRKCKILGHKFMSEDFIADAMIGMFNETALNNLNDFADMMKDMEKTLQDKTGKESDCQIGLNLIEISHKDLKTFYDKFGTIGKLGIDESKKHFGGSKYISDFETLSNHFDNLEHHIEAFNKSDTAALTNTKEEWFDMERLLRN
ncbi:hypothetical protein [Treponema pedis]|uniref:hypothetical protein n=1 Tax=Treponema pedis TaxID=409322 RepID=UPI000400E767|nr:hypothetical protein [Treponema pedis]